MYAALSGAKTMVMTKGDSVEANGWSIAAYNTSHDAEAGIVYDPQAIRDKISSYGSGRVNLGMYGNMLDRSGEAIEYIADLLKDEKPMVYYDDYTLEGDMIRDGKASHFLYFWINDGDVSTRYKAFEEALELMATKAEEHGCEFFYSTPAEQLIVDESGAVKGAIGKNEAGEYVQINASKGVLIATGNIVHDQEMLECFAPIGTDMVAQTAYQDVYTGDGHKMAMWANALMDKPPFTLGFSGDRAGAQTIGDLFNIPWLRVNLLGQRFINESLARRTVNGSQPLVNATRLQPKQTAFQICDAKYAEQIDEETFQKYLGTGEIVQANTLEELAALIDVDANELAKTVERYNQLKELGKDIDFGVEEEKWTAIGPVESAPFFAIEQKGFLGFTIGGIRTNRELQAVSNDGKLIEGLYVCGNALGGQFGYEFPFDGFGATNKMGAFVGGMLAVKAMLGTFDEAF